jgi:hypothetical protein
MAEDLADKPELVTAVMILREESTRARPIVFAALPKGVKIVGKQRIISSFDADQSTQN